MKQGYYSKQEWMDQDRKDRRVWCALIVVGIVAIFLVVGVAAMAAPTLVYDWDVLKDLPRKEVKTAVAEIDKKFFDAQGVALTARVKPDPMLIFEGKPYHGATTHYAGMDIPNTFDMFQVMGKWTKGEWIGWGLTTVATGAGSYVLYEKNKGSSSAPRAPKQSASLALTSGNRAVNIQGCAGDAQAKIENNESGSGDVTASCTQPKAQ